MKYIVVLVFLVGCAGCGQDKYPIAQLEDPNTCKTCHPKHFDQWSGSMHAYASEDPVFVAMNARGQREAQLGTFCVQCHAPMAVKLGLTDGTNYDPSTLPAIAKGITCYFCHNVDKVNDDHNNGLVLAMDQTMHGGANKPADTPAHDSLDDKNLMASETNMSTMCGSCHDIITPAPASVHIERSFAEWKPTIFNQPGINGLTCSACHMIGSDGVIAEGNGLNVGSRNDGFHDHGFPAIDQAISTFPNTDAQTTGIANILDPALTIIGASVIQGVPPGGGICLEPDGTLKVRMDTIGLGHDYPSGASQDRRVWLEVIAYDASNVEVFSSGKVGDNQDPEDLADPYLDCADPTHQPAVRGCSGFWDRMAKTDGSRADFFWEVTSETSEFLKPPITLVFSDPNFDHSTSAWWNVQAVAGTIDHITARIRTRPFSYKTLDSLVTSGDLDAQYAQSIRTLESSGATRMWTKATADPGTRCNPN
jgi:hypothetical protein